MNIYHADMIYTVDPSTHELVERYNTDDVQPVNQADKGVENHEPFWCSGLGYLDFLIKGTIIDEDGVEDVDYLVSAYTCDQSHIIPVELVTSNPRQYLTREIAKRIVTLNRVEIEDLYFEQNIFDELDRRFPGIKPISH